MDQTDDAPGVGAPSDASVNSDTHQRTVPVAVMQMPSTADSAASANPSILGPSMLRTPKVTQPQVPHKSCSPTTDDNFPQKSTEPLAADKYLTESGDTKKRKFKDESMEEMMQGQTFNELFVGPNEPFAVPLKGKTKLRRLDSTISPEVHAIVSDLSAKFLLRLQQIESEPDELPVAPQHLACSSDGRVRAYNPADEKKFFNVSIDRPSYGKAIKMRKAIVEFILDGMEALDKFHEEWMDNENRVFRKKFLANASSKKSNKHARSVGLIGDPGVGKSMLLNNLLNILNAALSKSSRKSTTNVRHEYVCTNPQSSAPYVAVVHSLDKRTIDTKVQEQVRKVLEFRDYDQDTPSDEYDQTEHDKLKQAKGTALEYLASLVVAPDAELEFRQESSLDNYIMGGEEREVVRTLSSCIDAYRLSQGCFGPTGKTTFTANSIGQLVAKPGLRQFENYTRHSSDARARWRLVEKVTCYLDAFILEHDVTVIDYPGTNLDNDQTRDENGQEGIKSCDVIVLLVKYERSRDSKTLEDTLRKCIRLGKIVKLCVGHLDSFKDNDPLADEEEEDPELLEICALEDEYEADPERMRELMSLKYSRRLEVRGASYAKEMKDYYSDLQKQETGCEGAELQVYPLLNREHAFYVKGFNINADPGRRPGVALEKTGVASLLFDVYGLPAETMLREESRLKFNLESLSIAAKLYCVSSKLERKQLIEHFVNEPRGVCARKVDNLVADLKKKMKEALDAVVLERQKAWSKAGKKLSDKWATKHHSNYLSFCKNSGSHQTAGEREEWNEDVHQIIHGDLVRTFEKVWAIVKRSKEDFYRCVTDLMKGITTNLKESPELLSQDDELQPFYKYVEQSCDLLQTLVEEAFESLEPEIRAIASRALDPVEPYLAESMQVAYELCKSKTGKKCYEERKKIMKSHLSSTEKGVFRDTIDKTIKGLHVNIDKWARDLKPTLETDEQESDEDEGDEEEEDKEEGDEQENKVIKIALEDVFADVAATFHGSYLEEDREESQVKVDAKRVLRQIIDTAEVALPMLAREMEKCRN